MADDIIQNDGAVQTLLQNLSNSGKYSIDNYLISITNYGERQLHGGAGKKNTKEVIKEKKKLKKKESTIIEEENTVEKKSAKTKAKKAKTPKKNALVVVT